MEKQKPTGFDMDMQVADCAFSTQFEIDNARKHSSKKNPKLCPKRK